MRRAAVIWNNLNLAVFVEANMSQSRFFFFPTDAGLA